MTQSKTEQLQILYNGYGRIPALQELGKITRVPTSNQFNEFIKEIIMHGVAKPTWDAVDHKWDQPFLPSVQQYIILLEKRIEELENPRETSKISFYFNKGQLSKEKAKELLEKIV